MAFKKLELQLPQFSYLHTKQEDTMTRNKIPVLFVLLALLLASLACDFSASTANISEAFLSNTEDGSAQTTTFAQDEVIYSIVVLKNAPDETVVKTEWIAVDVENTEPNYLIDTVEVTTGSDTLTFNLSNTGLWPVGDYRADIYLNEELTNSLTFTVQ